MTDDIVARLRAVLHNDRSVELMNREAADEIARLRDQSELLAKEIASLRVGDTIHAETMHDQATTSVPHPSAGS